MPLPVLFSVILLSLTTTQIHLVRSEMFMDLDLGSGAGVQVIDVKPCVEEPGSVKRLDMDLLVLQENFTECDNTRKRETFFRVKTTSHNATVEDPLVFVARDSNNVQTWKLPLVKHNNVYNYSYHTLCQVPSPNVTDVIFIDTFTSSKTTVSYGAKIEPIDDFVLEINQKIEFRIHPNEPQVRFFKFPTGSSDVQVVVTSNTTNSCAIVSVQNASCPFSDIEPEMRSLSIYQTMTTDSVISIDEHQTTSDYGLFIVIAMTDPSHCFMADEHFQTPSYQDIQLVVETQKPALEYRFALALPFIAFVTFGLIMTCLVSFPCCHIIWNPFVCGRKSCDVSISRPTCNSPIKENETAELTENDDDESDSSHELIEVTHSLNNGKFTSKHKQKKLLDRKEKSIKITDLLNTEYDVLEKQYSVYAWNTVTVGIFYGLPAFQFVLTGELIFRASGNQDTCYFNFKCSRPLGSLDAFNSVWSNLGYVILGLIFILIIAIKHYKARQLRLKQPDLYFNYGIPHFFGIYYALGIALILEGFMSSCYHICPSFEDFQFDSAFMYIISGLLIVKIFQTRHPDIHANAFVAFLCFAIVIFLTLVGIHEDTILYWSVRVILVCLVLFTITLIWLSFYFYHDWHMSDWIDCGTYKEIWQWYKGWCLVSNKCDSLKPRHMGRFTKVIVAVVGNFVLGLIIISVSHKEVAVVVLALFIANFLLYTALYLLSKLWFKEPWTLMSLVSLVALSVSWLFGFYLLLDVTARREVPPAQSREFNRDCIILDFYDTHDLWHFVSAVALFFTFLFVLTMDDGLQTQKRNKINVF
uniref:SID1 transmembrane family member 1 n=2 Tax=Amphimedon queenslandica TaxID=400682 RepID=A0A1X7VVV3_AMPQE